LIHITPIPVNRGNFRGTQVHWDLRAREAYKASLGSKEEKGASEIKVNMVN
jgi:hypothetical protein